MKSLQLLLLLIFILCITLNRVFGLTIQSSNQNSTQPITTILFDGLPGVYNDSYIQVLVDGTSVSKTTSLVNSTTVMANVTILNGNYHYLVVTYNDGVGNTTSSNTYALSLLPILNNVQYLRFGNLSEILVSGYYLDGVESLSIGDIYIEKALFSSQTPLSLSVIVTNPTKPGQAFINVPVKLYGRNGVVVVSSITVSFPPAIFSVEHSPSSGLVIVKGDGFDSSLLYYTLKGGDRVPLSSALINMVNITFPVNSTSLNTVLVISYQGGEVSVPINLSPRITKVEVSRFVDNQITITGTNINLKSTYGTTNWTGTIGNVKIPTCTTIAPNILVCFVNTQLIQSSQPMKLTIDGVSSPVYTFNPWKFEYNSIVNLAFKQVYKNKTALMDLLFIPYFLKFLPKDADISFSWDGVEMPLTIYQRGIIVGLPPTWKPLFTYNITFYGQVYSGTIKPAPYIESATPLDSQFGVVTITGYFLNASNQVHLATDNSLFLATVVDDSMVLSTFNNVNTNQIITILGGSESSYFYTFKPIITNVEDLYENILSMTVNGVDKGNTISINGVQVTNYNYPVTLSYLGSPSYWAYLPPGLNLKTNSKITITNRYGVTSAPFNINIKPRITSVYKDITSNNPDIITIVGKGLSITDYNGQSLTVIPSFNCSNFIQVGYEDSILYCNTQSPPTIGTNVSLTIGITNDIPVKFSGNTISILSYQQNGSILSVKVANLISSKQNIDAFLGGVPIISTSYSNSILTFNIPQQLYSGSQLIISNSTHQSFPVEIILKPTINIFTSVPYDQTFLYVNGTYFGQVSTILYDNITIGYIGVGSSYIQFFNPLKAFDDPNPSVARLMISNKGVLSDPITLNVGPKLVSYTTQPFFTSETSGYNQIFIKSINMPVGSTTFEFQSTKYTPTTLNPIGEFVLPLPTNLTDNDLLVISTGIDKPISIPIIPTALIFTVSPCSMLGGVVTVIGVNLAFGNQTPVVSNCTFLSSIDSNRFTCKMISADGLSQTYEIPFFLVFNSRRSNTIMFNYSPPEITSSSLSGNTLSMYGNNMGIQGIDNITLVLPYTGTLVTDCIVNLTITRCTLPTYPFAKNGIAKVIRSSKFIGQFYMEFTPIIVGTSTFHYDTSIITFYGSGLSINRENGSSTNITIQNQNITTMTCQPLISQLPSLTSVQCTLPANWNSFIEMFFNCYVDSSLNSVAYSLIAFPSIQEATGLIYQTSGIVTIKGRDFIQNSVVSAMIGSVPCLNTTLISSTEVHCFFDGSTPSLGNNTPINVQIKFNNNDSLVANAQVFLYDIIDNSCNPGSSVQCSGYGQCINGACLCNKNYTGISCETNTNNTNTNPDTPSTPSNPSQGTFSTSDLSVQFTHIRRLDISGNILETIPISPIKWNQTGNILTPYSNTSYYTALIDTRMKLNLQVIIFNDSATVTFAGERIQMEKNTLKFQIEAVSFGFLSSLQTMELVYAFNKPELDSCGDPQSTQTDYNSVDDLRWLTNKLGGSTLISRFNQRIFVDSRVVVSNTKILSPSDTIYQEPYYKDGNYTAVANLIPTFQSSAIVDPSIYLLIEAKDNSGACGEEEKKKSLWWVAVVVAVPSAIIIAATIVLVRRRKLKLAVRAVNSRFNKLVKLNK